MAGLQAANKQQGNFSIRALVIEAAVMLLIGFVVLVLAMLAGFDEAYALVHTNPFAAYEALWPGQPDTTVAEYARNTPAGLIHCDAPIVLNEAPARLTPQVKDIAFPILDDKIICNLNPQDHHFSSIRITLSSGQVQRVVFLQVICSEMRSTSTGESRIS